MQVNADINGKKVTIELTPEQVADIARQTTPRITVDTLLGLEQAEQVLEGTTHTKYVESQFVRKKDWVDYQLETIIKAGNFIDNDYKEWPQDFTKSSIKKHIPYFQRTDAGWSLLGVYCTYGDSDCPVGLYYKKESTARTFAQRFNPLYNQHLG